MTTYHVELTGYCDVIVEANSEQEAFDRAVARIPSSSLSIEIAEVKGVLEGEALKQAYRYFPEHLAMERTYMENDPVPGTTYTNTSVADEEAKRIYNQLILIKNSGLPLEDDEQEFIEQYEYNNELFTEVVLEDSYKDKMMACFDEDNNFVGLVGQLSNGTYKIVKSV